MGCAEMYRSGNFTATGARAGLILFFSVIARSASAQSRDTTGADTTRVKQLKTITVTAERPRAAAPPVTTLVVPAAELRRTFANNPYDLLRRTSGIEVHEQGQGPGFASDAVIRGFSSDHSSDVLLVLDGVPINLPVHGHVEGYSDWSILSPAAVSSLRVITGPASPLYGDFALAGVVEVFTAADAVGTTGSVSARATATPAGGSGAGAGATTAGILLAGEGGGSRVGATTRPTGWATALLRGWRQAGSGRLEGGLALYGSSWDSPGFLSVDQYNAGRPDLRHGSHRRRLGVPRDRPRAIQHRCRETGIEATAWLQQVHSDVFLTIPEDGLLEPKR